MTAELNAIGQFLGGALAIPVTSLLTFVALALDPALYTAVFARANRELLQNALADPVRALSYNALPFRFRGRIRALLEGIVFYAAMSLAGLALLELTEVIRSALGALSGR